MTDAEILELIRPIWADMENDQFDVIRPLLAHYTSIPTLKSILENNEIWLSNPLFMNDVDEVKFGIFNGVPLVYQSRELAEALKTLDRINVFKSSFDYYVNEFSNRHILDTYVFCLSEHDKTDVDGRLSMWRGYGSNGNGVALVFDTATLTKVEGSPLIVSKVKYANIQDRLDWLNNLISLIASSIRSTSIPDEKLHIVAFQLFERIKMFALFTKHHGFKEEEEWRIALFY